jgi:hypothetical protein
MFGARNRCGVAVGHGTMTHSMRLLISLLVLTLTTIGLPGLLTIERTAAAASTHRPTTHGRGAKKRPKPRKANKAEKKPLAEKKAKKNDRGFEL